MYEVNSLWIGKKLSPINIISINSFLQNGFKYNLYVYDKVENIPNGVTILDANEIIDESEIFYYRKGFSKGSPSGFACFFRYILLYETWVRRLLNKSGKLSLSQAALETLAIVAYKQPVNRYDIEAIRGVDCTGVIKTVLDKNLVKIKGRDEGPGHIKNGDPPDRKSVV